MKTFEYKLLRFVPDRVSGEFVNVGLILQSKGDNYLNGRTVDSVSRLSTFFPGIDGRKLTKTFKYIQSEFDRYAAQIGNELHLTNSGKLDQITQNILPKDDSALIFTETREGLDLNAEVAFEDLFERLVLKHTKSRNDDTYTDHDVWTRMYKKHFEKHGITNYLKSHTVHTKHDHIEFDHAFKNGKWNLFQSVSFDLKMDDSIRNKVYKWDGKVRELATSDEGCILYLLSRFPGKKNKALNQLITDKLNQSLNGVSVKLVSPDKIEQFVEEIKSLFDEHSN